MCILFYGEVFPWGSRRESNSKFMSSFGTRTELLLFTCMIRFAEFLQVLEGLMFP